MTNNSAIQINGKLSLSVKEVVEVTGLSRATIFKLIKEGKIKAEKVYNRRIILASDLLEFLKGLNEPPAEPA